MTLSKRMQALFLAFGLVALTAYAFSAGYPLGRDLAAKAHRAHAHDTAPRP